MLNKKLFIKIGIFAVILSAILSFIFLQKGMRETSTYKRTQTSYNSKEVDACVVLKKSLSTIFNDISLKELNTYRPSYVENKSWYSSCQYDDANNPFALSASLELRVFSSERNAYSELEARKKQPLSGDTIISSGSSSYSKNAFTQTTASDTYLYYSDGTVFVRVRLGGGVGIKEKVELLAKQIDDVVMEELK